MELFVVCKVKSRKLEMRENLRDQKCTEKSNKLNRLFEEENKVNRQRTMKEIINARKFPRDEGELRF